MGLLKKFFKLERNSNLRTQNIFLALLLGVGILIYGANLFSNEVKNIDISKENVIQEKAVVQEEQNIEEKENVQETSSMQAIKNKENTFEKQLEDRLGHILSKIEGAGEVQVMVTVESSRELVIAKDERNNNSLTKEKDLEGGTREINAIENDVKVVLQTEKEGDMHPIIVKEIEPKVKGVLVLANGGDMPKVQTAICDAVTTVLDIPVNKVQVIKKTK